MALRLVMMGTGSFAVPTLRGLSDSAHEVAGVFTQPDRRGRGHHRHVNPVKQTAEERQIPVFQPESVNADDSLAELESLDADLFVTAAYGQILSSSLLGIPRLGAINVHASLLPKYRGAAPIPYAIWKGESTTGVTIFQIEPRLDAGPILGKAEIEIGRKETAGQLEQRLSELAVLLILRVIDGIEAGTIEGETQDATLVSKAPRLKKSTGAIDWPVSSEELERHVRAMQPWPTAFTFLQREGEPPLRLILLDVEPVSSDRGTDPGSIVSVDDDRLVVQTGTGAVEIRRIQPSGKRAMQIGEFLRGNPVSLGDRLGPEAAA